MGLPLLIVGFAACSNDDTSTSAPPDPCPVEGDEWGDARAYIEHNATDEDTGFHGFFGIEGWTDLCVVAPDGEQLWFVDPQGPLGELGVADFFFESREPPNDEYSIDDLKGDFAEGDYRVAGTDFEGIVRVGTARFTHDIPAAPGITFPPLVDDFEEQEPPVIPATGLVVEWEPVTETIDGEPVTITGYQIIVTDEEAEDPDGWARPVYDVHVADNVTSFPVPDGFLQNDHLYEVEVLAIEESGNQTISVGFFRTE